MKNSNMQGLSAQELRIGNWVKDGNEFEQIQIEHLICLSSGRCEFDPIPLTEELLVKFGFYYNQNDMNYFKCSKSINTLNIEKWKKKVFVYCFVGGNTYINHVHQLQNLYFALTGEELKLTK